MLTRRRTPRPLAIFAGLLSAALCLPSFALAVPDGVRVAGLDVAASLEAKAATDATLSGAYLSLDQGIDMAALGNALGGDMLRQAFVTTEVEAALQQLLALETSGAVRAAGPSASTPGRRVG